MLSNKKAFTLIEVLIVVTIIGVMASLAIPRFLGQSEKARVAEAIGILGAIRKGQAVYFNENGSYPSILRVGNATNPSTTEWAKLGMAPPSSPFWAFESLQQSGFGITTGVSRAWRTGTNIPTGCTNSRVALTVDLIPAFGNDPWFLSSGCYAPNQPYHPAR